MHTKRTRFATDIITEFLPPKRPSNKVVIFCDGLPTMPGNKKNLLAMRKRGYWGMYPRYRGTWESNGYFLDHDPVDDIRDVVESLNQRFVDYWTGEEFHIENPEIYIVGMSFGGPAALLLSSHPNVKKVVSVCGVVDWTDDSEVEPLPWLFEKIRDAFGNGYRFKDQQDWKQLAQGNMYQPVAKLADMDATKILQIHAMDDDIVPYKGVHQFHETLGTTLITFHKGGHYITGAIRKWHVWRKIKKHFES